MRFCAKKRQRPADEYMRFYTNKRQHVDKKLEVMMDQ